MRQALRHDLSEPAAPACAEVIPFHGSITADARHGMTVRRAITYWIVAGIGIGLAVFILSSSATALELSIAGVDGKEMAVRAITLDGSGGTKVPYVSAPDVARLVGGTSTYDPISRVCTITTGARAARLLVGSSRYVATASSPELASITGSFDEAALLASGAVFISQYAARELVRLLSNTPAGASGPIRATVFPGATASRADPMAVFPPETAKPGAKATALPDTRLAPFIRNIVIDAGHGALDAGAVGPGGTNEKYVNLAVAMALEKSLAPRIHGKIHMTRRDDTFVSLPDRVSEARNHRSDLFISVHSNSAPGAGGREASGTEVYFFSAPSDADAKRVETMHGGSFDPKSEGIDPVLWNLMLVGNVIESHRLAKTVSSRIGEGAALPNRGVKSARFYVLHYGVVSNIPSILVELGFLSNPAEEKKLGDVEWQEQTAKAIADAVCEYLEDIEKRYPNGNGWTVSDG